MITVSWAQLLVGTSTPVLQDTQPLPHLTPMVWIPVTCQFLQCLHGHIELKQTFLVPLQCKHRLIMDAAMEYTKHPKTLQLLNAC